LCLKVQSHKQFNNLCVRVLIRNSDGEVLFVDSAQDYWRLNVETGTHVIKMVMPYLGLNPGSYIMDIWFLSEKLHVINFAPNITLNVELNKNIGYSIRSKFCQSRFWAIQSGIESN
jgi:lipopolysaccharide transport system ATP-binding protein